MNPTEVPADNSQTPPENNSQPPSVITPIEAPTQPTETGSPSTSVVTPSTNLPIAVPAPTTAETNPSVSPEPSATNPAADSVSPLAITSSSIGASTTSIVSGGDTPPIIKKSFAKKSKLIAGGAALLGVLLIGSGYVFGFYIPSRPNNVWKTGLTRTGKAVDSLVKTATDPKVIEQFKNSELGGNIDFTSNDYKFSGSFTAKLNATKSDSGITVSIKPNDQAEQKLNLNILTELPDQSQFPNIYFQLSGIKTLGLDSLMPGISAYDGKWIDVEASYLESLTPSSSLSQTPAKDRVINSDDIAKLARSVSATTNEYLFTADPKKNVLEEKSFISKEKVDGIDAYHYTATINKAHAKDFCYALNVDLYTSSAYKKLADADQKAIDDAKLSAKKDCDSSVDSDIKDDKPEEVWVDAKCKLIYKIRAYDTVNKDNYTEVGQNYKGGDSLSLFVNVHDAAAKTDGKFTLDTNLKTNNTKATLTYDGTSTDKFNLKITFEAKPYKGDVSVTKPAGAIPIQELLQKLGLADELGASAAANSSGNAAANNSKDAERQSDIRALDSQLEVFNAQNGYYPKLDFLNSDSWRATNMKGLDKEAFKDPDGTSYSLAAAATAKQYGYAPTGCSSKGECTSFKLSAMLSTGSLYTKDSLN